VKISFVTILLATIAIPAVALAQVNAGAGVSAGVGSSTQAGANASVTSGTHSTATPVRSNKGGKLRGQARAKQVHTMNARKKAMH
jgi:hypothetical protein